MEVLLDIQKAIKGDKDAFNRIIAEYEKNYTLLLSLELVVMKI